MSTRALEALDRILNRGGDPDDVLRSVVRTLAEEPGISWAGIAFLEARKLTLGPETGAADESRRVRIPVSYQGDGSGSSGSTERLSRGSSSVWRY